MFKPNEGEYIEGFGFIVEVIRTQRKKTADVRVDDGAVSVVVPMKLTHDRISEILNSKRHWINQKIVMHRNAQPVSVKEFVSGESFSYLGRHYRLKVINGPYKPVKLMQGRLIVTVPNGEGESNMVRNALVRWYKQHAEQKLQEKLKRYATLVDVNPESVGVKSFKSRWGSCTSSGKIDFNWKIILAPNRIVDYVVVHELCHLKQHDHSTKFWKEVERVMPDYIECKKWLKDNSAKLDF